MVILAKEEWVASEKAIRAFEEADLRCRTEDRARLMAYHEMLVAEQRWRLAERAFSGAQEDREPQEK